MCDLQFGLSAGRDRKDEASSVLLFGLQIKNSAEFFNGFFLFSLRPPVHIEKSIFVIQNLIKVNSQ